MKYPKLSILALSAATAFAACNSKLDLSPADALDDKTAVTEGNSRILANGLYERAQEIEYYGRDFTVVNEVTGNDVKITSINSNRFVLEYQYMFTPLSAAQNKTWLNAYRVANQASTMIDKLPDTEMTLPYKGEAHFMRALAHLDLARRYTKPYSIMLEIGDVNAANTGLPLAMKAVDDPAKFKPSRSTLKETYDAIIGDLKVAQTMAPDSKLKSDGAFRASRNAATALLTRVYLYQKNWANVITEANKLMNDYALWSNPNYLANFTSDAATSEEIFSLRFLTPENRGSDNIGGIYLPNDNTPTSGYGDVRLADGFMALLDPADYRNTIVKNFAGGFYMMKWIGNGQGITGMTNIKVLRISEVLLNRAEAYAQDNQLQLAVNDINSLRTKRGLTAFAGATQAEILTEIFKQRRLELIGEGFGATDLFRTHGTRQIVDADGFKSPNTPVVPFNNNLVAFPIPQTEIDANPNIVQNPGYNK
ncbi:RagB/SusD family nutrient uptake outer membrane protein [Chitinophaga flava]|uniref:RagB/SusD family nutrient uptake outer membrane protein n=1 Tax=Chitinophaga flava TaxID=2259036 RepID=A0A365Y5N0_9BACT|nr:RagB/SusD family nutrient uptake outer membrane protein [Chitinophaga flava]RBL93195.1 hypothetical protein DF182_11685 [Chitinophaga flava]